MDTHGAVSGSGEREVASMPWRRWRSKCGSGLARECGVSANTSGD
ncbi:hypothetical protein AK972_1141 [Pseudomonas yamanorum]|nr:hypothetical protein AK972_1141 [Pseudomonas yamanorum]